MRILFHAAVCLGLAWLFGAVCATLPEEKGAARGVTFVAAGLCLSALPSAGTRTSR
jgi:hypothetical protein